MLAETDGMTTVISNSGIEKLRVSGVMREMVLLVFKDIPFLK